jgi:hypothetical protein
LTAGSPVRDLGRLSEYRQTALWRRQVRTELGLPPLDDARAAEVLRRGGAG